jgi:hypothetical protein
MYLVRPLGNDKDFLISKGFFIERSLAFRSRMIIDQFVGGVISPNPHQVNTRTKLLHVLGRAHTATNSRSSASL